MVATISVSREAVTLRDPKRIIEMAEVGSITFAEYHDLFVVSHLGNPWQLIRYYMLSDDIADFNSSLYIKTIEEVDNNKLNNNNNFMFF